MWEGEIHLLPVLNLSKKSLHKVLNIILGLSKKWSLSFVVIKTDPKMAFERRSNNIPYLNHSRFKANNNISLIEFEKFESTQNYLIGLLKEKGFKVLEQNLIIDPIK